MGVLRTNEDDFDTAANINNYIVDQHYEFTIPERGANSYFQILPKNYAISQIVEDTIVHTLSHDDDHEGIVQVFKANFDNINNVKFLTKGTFPDSEQTILIDGCEYETTPAAQAAWVTNNNSRIYVQSVDWDDYEGSYCLGFSTNSRAEGYYVTHTFDAVQDWTDLAAIDFMWQSEAENDYSRWQLQVQDNIGQVATVDFSVSDDDNWMNKHFSRSIFYNTNVVDWSKIVSLTFKNLKSGWTHWCYLDELKIIKNIDNTHIDSKVHLIHFGTNPDFSTLGPEVTLDNNKDYKTFIIQNDTKRITPCRLQYGARRNDWKLVNGDYYGLYIEKPDKGSINFYGAETNVYNDGDLYDVHGTTLTALNKSLSFMVCTFSESYLRKLVIRQDVHSPKSNINLMVMNSETKKVERFLGIYTFDAQDKIEIEYDYSSPESIKLDKDSHLYIYYQDSQTSEASMLYVCPRFHYNKIEG